VRIILDTAILVRGHGSSKGLARDLLIGIVESDHILLLSNEMLYELAKVLRYPRMLALHGISEKRIYGGIFSGGYVTLLTALFVATFRMTFIEAVATTKLINVFSSGVATVIFMRRELVDYRLGAVLGVTMFVGALLGARFARRLGNLWIRRIYFVAVWLLGLKILLFDLLGTGPVKRRTTP
jgi:hypothetical protein